MASKQAPSVIVVASAQSVAVGHRVTLNGAVKGKRDVRIAAVNGLELTVTPWRWWHAVAGWPLRALRAAGARAREIAAAFKGGR